MTSVGQQGNPHLWRSDDGYAVFYDDEVDRDDLFVVETEDGMLDQSWDAFAALPPQINSEDGESQPFFDGATLWFRRELTIMASDYQGGSFASVDAWSTPRVDLQGRPLATEPGAILGAGEPTVAEVDGKRELYFIFVERAGDGTLNLDVGRVRHR